VNVKLGLSFGVAIAAATVLSGCGMFRGSSSDCRDTAVYAGAESVEALKIPAGLQAPDTRNALKVPDLNVPEAPRAAGSACLDAPPPYTAPAKPAEPEA
jgi:uncharacterized lipoprotein